MNSGATITRSKDSYRPGHGVRVLLACCNPGCEAHIEDRPTFRGTKLGGTRLHLANPHWYVDGGTVRCPEHQTEAQKARVMQESWHEYEIRGACDTLGIHARRELHCEERWVVDV